MISVITLVRGRRSHLENLMKGLAGQSRAADELVIGVMEEAAYEGLPDPGCPVRQVVLSEQAMNLSAARNRAAAAATGEILVFLDVDCIPDPDCLADYSRALQTAGGLAMGEISYLPAGATDGGIDYDHFNAVGERHSDRRGPPAQLVEQCTDYRCFWSLTFAMRARTFEEIGGFDERFSGYGGEDTDFARMVDEAGVPLWWVKGARAFHQHHAHHMPPVHHLDSVLHNTEVFRRKWGHPTMGHWIHAFKLMGLVGETDKGYVKLRDPGEAEFAMTRQDAHMPYANSARVIRRLEAAIPVSVAAE